MYHIGIDLGGTNIAVGIVDEGFNIIIKGKTPTKAERHADEIIADMGKLCLELISNAGLTPSDVSDVGIASPGAIDPQNGVVTYAPNLPFLNYPIVSKLKNVLHVKNVYIENDANAAALGESIAGASKGSDISLMITLGTGVGGGVIIGGKIYTGFNYAGAELGHMVIVHDGRQCGCGRKGCFEAYSSANALAKITAEEIVSYPDSLMWKEADGKIENVDARTAFSAMKKGDADAKKIVDKYISYLSCGITNLINIFQPNVLLIGGGVCNEGDNLLVPLKAIVDKDQYTRNNKIKTEIKIAKLGNDAGIIGAAALFTNH